MLSRLALCAIAFCSVACGSNAPEIPDELKGQSGAFGSEVGQNVENFCFQGWRDPVAANFDPQRFETICVYDYADSTKGFALLMLNTAALWCGACRLEHQALSGLIAPLEPRGFGFLSLLFQDNESNPATPQDLVTWTENFSSDYPMALDPDYLMGRYAPPTNQPLNMLLDARTMKILDKWTGDQRSVIWPTVESELEQRGR